MAIVIVFSDIHGNLPALEAAWRDISARPRDAVFCLGDICAFGPWPDETVSFLRDVIRPRAVVRGNTDRWVAGDPPPGEGDAHAELLRALEWTREHLSPTNLEWLRGLPASHEETIEGSTMEFLHGGPGDDELRIAPGLSDQRLREIFAERAAGVTFCGHTHIPLRRRAGDRLIINDGSVGFPFDGDSRATYVRVKVVAGQLHDFEHRRVSYHTDGTVAAISERGMPMAATLIRRLRFAQV